VVFNIPFFTKKNDKKKVSNIGELSGQLPLATRVKYRSKFVFLLILDGFGIHPDELGNAVIHAKTPNLDTMWTKGVSTLIQASGVYVGLPPAEHGNSEVGHLSLGVGTVIQQSLPRINDSMKNGSFDTLPTLKNAFAEVKARKSNFHLIGLISAGGVHGHIDHLFYMLELCRKNGVNPYIHAILDGRDTGETDGYFYTSKLFEKIKKIRVGKLASMCGRFYTMDRDKRWERTKVAYDCMVGKGARSAKDPFVLLQEAYKSGETDEFFKPTTMVDAEGNPIGSIKDNDVVMFLNFREDRARQTTRIFVDPAFDGCERIDFPKNLFFITMTGYEESLKTEILFKPRRIEDTLSYVLSKNGLKQLHISETEKYAHVTYFFNGGIEETHPGEKFYQIPSPHVLDYSKIPEMSTSIITDQLLYELDHLDKSEYSFIMANFANPDMVAHTGDMTATIVANQNADSCAGKIAQKVIEKGGSIIIVGDHGNCETMIDRETKKVDKAHSNNPVPFIFINNASQLTSKAGEKLLKIGTGEKVQVTGILADVAPCVLSLLGLSKPPTMTGVDLINIL